MKIYITFLTALLLSLTVPACLFSQGSYSLDFNPDHYTEQTLELNGKAFTVRAYERMVYVKNPVDTNYEIMNIYIPVEYFEGGRINGYTASTAPIFLPNQVGGYMPALPASTKNSAGFGSMPPGNGPAPDGHGKPNGAAPPMPATGPGPMRPSAVLFALSQGYVVAAPGARGRTTRDKTGKYTGKAPAALVDLKAAVRYLKYNDKNMPGDANKIISNGTSAGGAMSTLLGATGNNPDYLPYLKELGAANTSDDIFAVSAYCPITNLDHADMAYEWQFNGIYTYQRFGPPPGTGTPAQTLSASQINVSKQLKDSFPAYVNELHLKDGKGELLTLDSSGNGRFRDYVKTCILGSANSAIRAGADLSGISWLELKNGEAVQLDFDGYLKYLERQKAPPAFDALDLSTPENNLFGNETVDKKHFTAFSSRYTTVSPATADTLVVKMMNPMNYIAAPNTITAKHWRLRHGTKDKDTGLAIPVILATYLQNKGYEVNFELPWDRPHSGDYDLDQLFKWADGICKKNN